MSERVSAVFSGERDAQDVMDWLEGQSVPQEAISVVAPRAGEAEAEADPRLDAREISDAAWGTWVGAGVGSLFGLAAVLIPGVGPFVAAGALSSALGAVAGGLAAGAVVGGTAGGIAGALTHWGVEESAARYYAGEVEQGGIYIGVDTTHTSVSREAVEETFRRHHGRIAP